MLIGTEKSFGTRNKRVLINPRISGNKEVTMSNIIIHEVRLSNGLQVEKNVVPMEQKMKWVEALSNASVKIIQLGSV